MGMATDVVAPLPRLTDSAIRHARNCPTTSGTPAIADTITKAPLMATPCGKAALPIAYSLAKSAHRAWPRNSSTSLRGRRTSAATHRNAIAQTTHKAAAS